MRPLPRRWATCTQCAKPQAQCIAVHTLCVDGMHMPQHLARDGCSLDEGEAARDLFDYELVSKDHLALALELLDGLAPVGARVDHVRLRVKKLTDSAFAASIWREAAKAAVRSGSLEGRTTDSRHHALEALGDILHDARDARRAPVHDVDVERHSAERVDEERERLDDELLALGVEPCESLAGREVKVLKDLRTCSMQAQYDLERFVALPFIDRRCFFLLLLRKGDRSRAARALVVALVVLGDMRVDLAQSIRRSVVVESV